jgi:hypothetical protein
MTPIFIFLHEFELDQIIKNNDNIVITYLLLFKISF